MSFLPSANLLSTATDICAPDNSDFNNKVSILCSQKGRILKIAFASLLGLGCSLHGCSLLGCSLRGLGWKKSIRIKKNYWWVCTWSADQLKKRVKKSWWKKRENYQRGKQYGQYVNDVYTSTSLKVGRSVISRKSQFIEIFTSKNQFKFIFI